LNGFVGKTAATCARHGEILEEADLSPQQDAPRSHTRSRVRGYWVVTGRRHRAGRLLGSPLRPAVVHRGKPPNVCRARPGAAIGGPWGEVTQVYPRRSGRKRSRPTPSMCTFGQPDTIRWGHRARAGGCQSPSWRQIPSELGSRYGSADERSRAAPGSSRGRSAPQTGCARRRERTAAPAAHRGRAEARRPSPVGTVAAFHDGSGRTTRAGVALGHAARPAGDDPTLAPGGLPRVLAATIATRRSAAHRQRESHPPHGGKQSALGPPSASEVNFSRSGSASQSGRSRSTCAARSHLLCPGCRKLLVCGLRAHEAGAHAARAHPGAVGLGGRQPRDRPSSAGSLRRSRGEARAGSTSRRASDRHLCAGERYGGSVVLDGDG
jgi:hypothetical protein